MIQLLVLQIRSILHSRQLCEKVLYPDFISVQPSWKRLVELDFMGDTWPTSFEYSILFFCRFVDIFMFSIFSTSHSFVTRVLALAFKQRSVCFLR